VAILQERDRDAGPGWVSIRSGIPLLQEPCGLCRSLDRQRGPGGDRFVNPSVHDTPEQLVAPVRSRPRRALCRFCMPGMSELHPRVRNVTPSQAESRQLVEEPH